MNNQIGAITKLNLKNIRVPYFVTGLISVALFVQTVTYTIVAFAQDKAAGSQLFISNGNYLWLLIILAAIFIPVKNFRRVVNLGGKRNGFFWGSITSYTVLAGAVSIVNTIYFYTFERFLISTGYFLSYKEFAGNMSLLDTNYVNVNLIELFGWTSHGIFFAIIQQFAFLLLLAFVIHTITAMQDKWYGWVVDILIAAFLALFIPISVLRPALLMFFDLIIFNKSAFLQIAVCLILAIAIYMLNKPVFAKKVI